VIKIDKSQHDHRAGKKAGCEEKKGQGVFLVDEQKTQGCQNFDKKIGKGDFGSANAAFSPEEQKGENRNVVIKFYLFFTLGAGGWRPQEAFSQREPEDDNIEKAPPGQTEKQDDNYLFHHVNEDSTSPVSGS
jgi:hypothetical protein